MARRLLMTAAGAGVGVRRATILVLTVTVAVAAVVGLLNLPLHNGCRMTYMYPTYIPLHAANLTTKYDLFLYHEGWQKIDFELHLLKLSGVPVLFIPGNGGSYKQVRSLAAESDRAFNGGPPEEAFFRESVWTSPELQQSGHSATVLSDHTAGLQRSYPNHLDWFAVDLDGEHSAMDGTILEEHTEYVVQAVDTILDRYREAFLARSKSRNAIGEMLPTSVILVGHSMGGFVARAAVVHPLLRQGSVQTVLTLSSPHQSPPIALQPSLGHFFTRVNDAWIKGYARPKESSVFSSSDDSVPSLSNVIVVSIFGGTRDFQVRANLASLEGIVPSTNGLTIGAPEMLNVWLSMEHQCILWCNQLVIQVAHTLLRLIDPKSTQPVLSPQLRLAIFSSKLLSALAQTFDWLPPGVSGIVLKEMLRHRVHKSDKDLSNDLEAGNKGHGSAASYFLQDSDFACPKSIQWVVESQEKDLYIESPVVTVLAMDGRRRWLNIKKMASMQRDSFTMVTNLAPCAGVRVHLWPERDALLNNMEQAVSNRIKEVTMKFVQLPAGPMPLQTEPGGQTEQAPPSAVIRLGPEELLGFHYITISVAPQMTLSGRPPPAASMAVGQFLNVQEGSATIATSWILSSIYKEQEVVLRESHPLVMKLSVGASLGMLSMSVNIKTASCGITEPPQAEGDHLNICKRRCFPPVALLWDFRSGLVVLPSLYSETISIDSPPAVWSRAGMEQPSLVLVADPHCAYNISTKTSLTTTAGRFLLTYGLQISGFAVAVILFALLRQAHAWELDLPIPSILSCLESNMLCPWSLMTFCLGPLLVYLTMRFLHNEDYPEIFSLVSVSFICYSFASGAILALASSTTLMLYISASLHVYIKVRWLTRPVRRVRSLFHRLFGWLSLCASLQKVHEKPTNAIAVIITVLVFFVHPAMGLIVLSMTHGWQCHVALFRHRTTLQRNALKEGHSLQTAHVLESTSCPSVPAVDDSLENLKDDLSFSSTQLDLFNYRHGLLLLHLSATAMMTPSLVAWAQRPGWDRALPSSIDSMLCFGVIVHGLYGGGVQGSIDSFPVPSFLSTWVTEVGFSAVYLCAGFYCSIAGLTLVPYKAFNVLAAFGAFTLACRLRERCGDQVGKRRHYRKHRQS